MEFLKALLSNFFKSGPALREDLRAAASAWLGSVVLVAFGWSIVTVSALEWQTGEGFRKAPLPVSTGGKAGFTRLDSAATGVAFTNHLSDERSITNRNLLSGSGVAAGDVDGDGRCDVYFCSLGHGNVLYRNLGNWQFEDITAKAEVACTGQDSTGAVFADVDGDEDLDLLVNALGGGTRLFQNNGAGKFREVTLEAGLHSKAGSTSLALADVDGDSDLDLYVTNFRPGTIKDQPTTRFRMRMEQGGPVVVAVNDRPITAPDLTNRFIVTPSGTVLEQGEPDAIYLNDGTGRFSPLSFTGGAFLDEAGQPLRDPPRDWGLAVQFHDLNGDRAPDIYVCNDLHTPDRIWINNGVGKFRAIGNEAIRCTSVFSMGVDMGDVNRDGQVDIFVVDMFSREHAKRQVQVATTTPVRWPVGVYDYRPQFNRNTLQINRGDGTFAETAWFSGVEASEWSWGPIFLDVDLDGYEDIIVMNGQLRDFQNADLDRRIAGMKSTERMTMMEILRLVKLFPRLESPKLIFRNRGDLTFEEVGAAWGFASTGIAQGMALADLDNDGDLDVVTNNLNEGAGIYRNNSSSSRLAISLKGMGRNTHGIGARIQVSVEGLPVQTQEIIAGGRYLSGDQSLRVFAAGPGTNRAVVEVLWRDGKRSRISAEPNCRYELHQSGPEGGTPIGAGSRGQRAESDSSIPGKEPPSKRPLFEDVSSLLNHVHVEEPFDDFTRQPLLPMRLSQPGPGVCWQDFDGDGWDDLIISAGRTGQLGVFRNDSQGGFSSVTDPAVVNPAARDQTSVLVPALNTILAGSSNYEDGLTNGGCLRIYDLSRKVVGEAVLGQSSSVGPLAMADIDADGDLDIFIGGRAVPARYPEPATSLLMRNDGGRLTSLQRWDRLGLVNGAVFSDLAGDGFPDLILACAWGPIRVFENQRGVFTEATEKLGFTPFKGWWNGVAAGDIDGDGQLDLVASNWGLNSSYGAPDSAAPLRLHFGDFDGNAVLDLVEAHFDAASKRYVPSRGFRAAAAALPFLQENVASFETYGRMGVEEIYGDQLRKGAVLEANTLASTIFFNRKDRFEPMALPIEAQFAPAFGVCVGDLDGDGREDLFVSQNFFAVNPDQQPCGAGRSLWLRGIGGGKLEPVPGQNSGLQIYGEQRGCALSDYDRDGRLDLVVTQNGNRTKLYRNVDAEPAVRVRLKGPAGNPYGVGSSMWLEDDLQKGPIREIHAGSGYLSQDSPVQVMGFQGIAKRLHVRWPGGLKSVSVLPPGAREIMVGPDGTVDVIK